MIELTEEDKRFYSENASVLITYVKYIEFVFKNRDKFGGDENVSLALQIGKFIGRNEIGPKEFEEMKAGVKQLCKTSEKASRVMKVLEDPAVFQKKLESVISQNPKSFMVVSETGVILKDEKGNPIPNIMKVSLALAREFDS